MYDFPKGAEERQKAISSCLPIAELLRSAAKPSVFTVAAADLQDWEPKEAKAHAEKLEKLVIKLDALIGDPHRSRDLYKDEILNSRIPFIRIQFDRRDNLPAGEIVKLK